MMQQILFWKLYTDCQAGNPPDKILYTGSDMGIIKRIMTAEHDEIGKGVLQLNPSVDYTHTQAELF